MKQQQQGNSLTSLLALLTVCIKQTITIADDSHEERI
jgi:hypothetical protein